MIAASTPGAQRSRSNAITASAAAMIAQTPAARPSTPSEKLTTFISATRPTTVIAAPALGKCSRPTKGSAISFDFDAEVHDDQRRGHLPGELHQRRQVEAVVERPHHRDEGGGDQHAVPDPFVGQPDEPGHERAGEDRQAAEQRGGALGEAALARLVDRPDCPREAHRERRQQRRHNGGGQEGVQRVELVRGHGGPRTASQARGSCARGGLRVHARGELLVQRVALDQRAHPLAQLVGAGLVSRG